MIIIITYAYIYLRNRRHIWQITTISFNKLTAVNSGYWVHIFILTAVMRDWTLWVPAAADCTTHRLQTREDRWIAGLITCRHLHQILRVELMMMIVNIRRRLGWISHRNLLCTVSIISTLQRRQKLEGMCDTCVISMIELFYWVCDLESNKKYCDNDLQSQIYMEHSDDVTI